MDKEIIPIIFAVNDNYAAYCSVAIYSLRDHISSPYRYEIYIISTDLSAENQEKLKSLSKGDFNISVINVAAYVKEANLKGIHYLSVETFYRLFIPLIVPQYNKVLYLDSDICVLQDVSELFHTDLDGCALGAVSEVPRKNLEIHSKELGISDQRELFNAGVLLIDTALFEKNKIREACLEVLEEDYSRPERKLIYADQDALNIVMHNGIKWIGDKWNYLAGFLLRPHVIFNEYRGEYISNAKKAGIIHFSGQDKLWMYPELELAKKFWQYAKNTPFFYEILRDTLNRAKMLPFEKYNFPYDVVKNCSRIVIYGAGKVGRVFHQQLLITRYAKEVLWVDKEWREVDPELGVVSPETIRSIEFDCILLAVERCEIAEEMRAELLRNGVPCEKIVWKKYL